jgi:tetratricopeptide (TPR) repeat protein
MTRTLSRKLFALFALCVLSPWVSCAGGNGETPEEKEYGEIVNSGALGEELISALEDFEIRHGGHFDSKVDLGIYYLAVGETERARDYLRRAERILLDGAAGKRYPGKEGYAAVMYGALAQAHFLREEYQEALEYIDRAIGADGENQKKYHFLKGNILIARQEYRAALAIFDELFAAGSTEAGGAINAGADSNASDSNTTDSSAVYSVNEPASKAEEEELRVYMFLLAQAERPAEAAAILDRYLLTGAFFPGLGYFGATVYRTMGEMEKAAWAAYLEEEYRSGYGEFRDSGPGAFESLTEGIIPVMEAGAEGKAGEVHFAAEYARLKTLVDTGNVTKEDFLRLVGLEQQFRLFPSFYWRLWLGARLAYPEELQYFSAALQKIIALDKDGPFARGAWNEITRLMGY